MKIVELKLAAKNKTGVYHKNGVILKPYEESTAKLFISTPGMRRILIIRNDKQIFDIYK